ncbi:non-hydrolyzing UDP-N-acetylglucosamine 2-epimerase [Leucobacter iarius]|uniref:UDP-N-acetylglucosamine 2-epimerase (non-hydrolyzing) n=1 Tax=Leucobacter iarius TaxID=333963 RepID=A0ABP4XNC9_9MICO
MVEERLRRVLVIVGTRPEAIKMIPVIRALDDGGRIRPVVISTGQHTEMVRELFEAQGKRIDADLRVADPVRDPDSGEDRRPTLNEMVARVITGIDRIWRVQAVPERNRSDGRRGPDGALACLVHGDTSSAAAAALAAFNLQLPVVHVEAGLRTSNLLSPFPEEGNRQLISRIAGLHFAPTGTNRENLLAEQIDDDRIVVTGNTSIDMLEWATRQPLDFGPGLEDLTADPDASFVLVTAHRRENWGSGLDRIAAGVRALAERFPEVRFVVPLHPNPVARRPLQAALADLPNARLVEPRGYVAFAHLMDRALFALTDSGGVQEEAPALGTPVLVTRDTTERGEGVEAGTLVLVGTDPERILAEGSALIENPAMRAERGSRRNPYGDGTASERIARILDAVFSDDPGAMSAREREVRAGVRRRLGLPDPIGGGA